MAWRSDILKVDPLKWPAGRESKAEEREALRLYNDSESALYQAKKCESIETLELVGLIDVAAQALAVFRAYGKWGLTFGQALRNRRDRLQSFRTRVTESDAYKAAATSMPQVTLAETGRGRAVAASRAAVRDGVDIFVVGFRDGEVVPAREAAATERFCLLRAADGTLFEEPGRRKDGVMLWTSTGSRTSNPTVGLHWRPLASIVADGALAFLENNGARPATIKRLRPLLELERRVPAAIVELVQTALAPAADDDDDESVRVLHKFSGYGDFEGSVVAMEADGAHSVKWDADGSTTTLTQTQFERARRRYAEKHGLMPPPSSSGVPPGGDAVSTTPPPNVVEAISRFVTAGESLKTEIRQLKRQRDELQDRVLCAICMEPDAPRSVLFSPCNHLVACAACAPKLKECSLCRAPVKKRIKIKNSS